MLNFTSAQNKSNDITELQDKVDVMIFLYILLMLYQKFRGEYKALKQKIEEQELTINKLQNKSRQPHVKPPSSSSSSNGSNKKAYKYYSRAITSSNPTLERIP